MTVIEDSYASSLLTYGLPITAAVDLVAARSGLVDWHGGRFGPGLEQERVGPTSAYANSISIGWATTFMAAITVLTGFNITHSFVFTPAYCFPASTLIALPGNATKPISDIRPGDEVLAFDPSAAGGRGALVPRRVTRLYENVTESWIRVDFPDGDSITATPGHHMLAPDGAFRMLQDMVAQDGSVTLVADDGSLRAGHARRMMGQPGARLATGIGVMPCPANTRPSSPIGIPLMSSCRLSICSRKRTGGRLSIRRPSNLCRVSVKDYSPVSTISSTPAHGRCASACAC